MVIVSQTGNETTESLEFSIRPRKTCKNIFVDKKLMEKSNGKKRKGFEEFLERNMARYVYTIIERNSRLLFGAYETKEKAKEVLQEIVMAYKSKTTNKVYEIPKDKDGSICGFIPYDTKIENKLRSDHK